MQVSIQSYFHKFLQDTRDGQDPEISTGWPDDVSCSFSTHNKTACSSVGVVRFCFLVLGRRETPPLLTLQLRTLQSQNETVCCVAAEKDMANVGVRSAGFADGNEAG